MKLLSLNAKRYRSLRDKTISLTDLNLFIGTNASGKSTILDALRFLHEGVQERDFKAPVFWRGGMLNLAWKGDEAGQIQLAVELNENDITYEWVIRLSGYGHDLSVYEEISERRGSAQHSTQLLSADRGNGWWRSGERGQVPLALAPTA